MARDPLKPGWRAIGSVFIAVAIALNLPIGFWMIADGAAGRGFLQLSVAAALIVSGRDFRRRALPSA